MIQTQGVEQLLEVLVIVFDSSSWGHGGTHGDNLDRDRDRYFPVIIVGLLFFTEFSILRTRKRRGKSFLVFVLENLLVT